jgi:hypothetical protein
MAFDGFGSWRCLMVAMDEGEAAAVTDEDGVQW